MIVAGTNNVNNAEKTVFTRLAIGNPIKLPETDSIPNLDTITNTVPESKKVWLSLLETFVKPTSNPSKINIPYMAELYLFKVPTGIKLDVEIPISNARIIPTKKAHAPKVFSFALIAILFFFICFVKRNNIFKPFDTSLNDKIKCFIKTHPLRYIY